VVWIWKGKGRGGRPAGSSVSSSEGRGFSRDDATWPWTRARVRQVSPRRGAGGRGRREGSRWSPSGGGRARKLPTTFFSGRRARFEAPGSVRKARKRKLADGKAHLQFEPAAARLFARAVAALPPLPPCRSPPLQVQPPSLPPQVRLRKNGRVRPPCLHAPSEACESRRFRCRSWGRGPPGKARCVVDRSSGFPSPESCLTANLPPCLCQPPHRLDLFRAGRVLRVAPPPRRPDGPDPAGCRPAGPQVDGQEQAPGLLRRLERRRADLGPVVGNRSRRRPYPPCWWLGNAPFGTGASFSPAALRPLPHLALVS